MIDFSRRCNFIYDSLGNLYKKKCGQQEVQYIVDPFGNPGADIIGQVDEILSLRFSFVFFAKLLK